jgi:hypothetical protein
MLDPDRVCGGTGSQGAGAACIEVSAQGSGYDEKALAISVAQGGEENRCKEICRAPARSAAQWFLQ